jgi:hypothetical protein
MARTSASIVLTVFLHIILASAATAETPVRMTMQHIRTTDLRLAQLLDEGARQSETFRQLVERIHHSDVVVYLDCSGRSAVAGGRLAFVSSVGGLRYVHVRVARMPLAEQEIALIGHELRHAVEIADAAEVVDDASLARAYRRIGFLNPRLISGSSFDSHAAVEAGYQVLRELLGKDSVALPTPNLHFPSGRY